MFVTYVNSLPDVVNDASIYLFADDTKVFKQIKTDEDHHSLQQDLENMLNWTDRSLLKYNIEKCCVMTIKKKKDGPVNNRTYHLDGKELRTSEKERDLGVIVDSFLTFENHMIEKVNKANRIMGVIRRSYTYLDEKCFLLLYKALVRPHLEYCNQIWRPFLQKHINMIENVQRRATRQIPGFKDLTYEERLKKLNLPSLAYRRTRGDMIEAYKIATNKYDTAITGDLFKFNQRPSRGHHLKIQKERATSNLQRNSFFYRIVNTWNNLPPHVVEAENIQTFERRLDRHWINHELRYCHHHARNLISM